MTTSQIPNRNLFCFPFTLKLEMIIPFVLWESSGSPGSLGVCICISLCVALFNTASENWLKGRSTFLAVLLGGIATGLAIFAVNWSLVALWSAERLLKGPIAYYGHGSVAAVLILMILSFRALSLIGDGLLKWTKGDESGGSAHQ